ncbi:MAG: outer membrane beta-barrel protein [Candidatus Eisenbacteria bacterium]
MRRNITGGHRSTWFAIAALLTASSIAGPAAAKPPGFILGLDLHTSHIGVEEKTDTSPDNSVFVDETGGGLGLILGYAFTPSFFLRFHLSGSGHETNRNDVDVAYANGTVEAGYLFREGKEVRPFFYGGIGGFALESRHDDWRYETSGPGTAFGGGVFWFLTPNSALDFGARLEFMNWERTMAEVKVGDATVTVETPVDENGSAAKIDIGWSYWF